jgi:hypothetical protein
MKFSSVVNAARLAQSGAALGPAPAGAEDGGGGAADGGKKDNKVWPRAPRRSLVALSSPLSASGRRIGRLSE